ncbi:unnamed protein product [Caenorhabditis auriculariae]|uniref:Uncharacterized protein n=1 Tax=Caenorhabditis auriculariae TaxID=2777116 RepID=A0A8S1I0C6_9PELO|nr:unnamed protein product [Caenorhabditis auriculariae]
MGDLEKFFINVAQRQLESLLLHADQINGDLPTSHETLEQMLGMAMESLRITQKDNKFNSVRSSMGPTANRGTRHFSESFDSVFRPSMACNEANSSSRRFSDAMDAQSGLRNGSHTLRNKWKKVQNVFSSVSSFNLQPPTSASMSSSAASISSACRSSHDLARHILNSSRQSYSQTKQDENQATDDTFGSSFMDMTAEDENLIETSFKPREAVDESEKIEKENEERKLKDESVIFVGVYNQGGRKHRTIDLCEKSFATPPREENSFWNVKLRPGSNRKISEEIRNNVRQQLEQSIPWDEQ